MTALPELIKASRGRLEILTGTDWPVGVVDKNGDQIYSLSLELKNRRHTS
jgi:hypothetical protein